jgi:hypothetical protein
MAHVFAVMAGANWIIRVSWYTVDKWLVNCLGSIRFVNGHWRSVAVQTISKPEISQGVSFKLYADARVRVQLPLQIYLGCWSKSKKCDKQLTFSIVRIRYSCVKGSVKEFRNLSFEIGNLIFYYLPDFLSIDSEIVIGN